jgi:hypothetical protein
LSNICSILTHQSRLALRELAREESIPLTSLQHLCSGHLFGLSQIADCALSMYILLNLLVDKNLAHRGTAFLHGSLPGYDRYISSVSSVISDDEEDVPDRIFFHQWHAGSDQDSLKMLDNHLKLLFRRLYLYDWMITEAGGHVDWRTKILDALNLVTRTILNNDHKCH